jgi:hypothetical protein
MSASILMEMLHGTDPSEKPRQGIKAGCWPSAVFMNKWSLDTLPSLNLCSFCQERSCASPRVQHLFSKELGFVSMRNSLLIAASQLWH